MHLIALVRDHRSSGHHTIAKQPTDRAQFVTAVRAMPTGHALPLPRFPLALPLIRLTP
jgi:hypothetical protein